MNVKTLPINYYMELQNKFEEIITTNASHTGTISISYNDISDIQYAAKQCTILCLEEKIKLLESIIIVIVDVLLLI